MHALLTIAPDGAWSLGVLVGVPLLSLFLLLLIAVVVAAFWWAADEKGDSYGDRGLALGFAWAAVLAIVATLALALAPTGYYPYKGEYHQWRAVSGTVAEVGNRILTSDSGVEQKVVVRFQGSELMFGCQDTRCAPVKAGDVLDLKCKRAWQYASESGYDCRFVARKAAR